MRPVEPRRVVASTHQRKPGVRILRRGHLRRHHADDGEILIVQVNRATDCVRIAIECALPKTIADHDDGWSADFVFVFAKCAAGLRRQPDDIEKIPCDRRARNALRFAAANAAQISRFFVCDGELFENRVVISPIEGIGQRNREILPRSGRLIQYHDAVGIRIWERPQQNGVDHTEDGGVGADAQAERNYRDGSKAGLFRQHAQCVAKILHHIARRFIRCEGR